jgi:hypothetical protein
MLPEMDSAEATRFAERIRQAVLGMRVHTAAGPISLTRSFSGSRATVRGEKQGHNRIAA